MARPPHTAPLGAKPVLPAPTGAKAAQATRLFQKLVQAQRAAKAADEEQELPSPPAAPPPANSPRRYERTLAAIAQAVAEAGSEMADVPVGAAATDAGDDGEANDDAVFDATGSAEAVVAADTAELPMRPPPGVPTVRPSARQRQRAEAVPDGMLERSADSALLRSEPDGGTSFDIAFKDDLFDDLSCRITVRDGEVVATFFAPDRNTRRLLEAEAGRLRVALEGRGLRVAAVQVVDAEPTP